MSMWASRSGQEQTADSADRAGSDAGGRPEFCAATIRDRIRSGFYDSEPMLQRLARRLLETDAVCSQP